MNQPVTRRRSGIIKLETRVAKRSPLSSLLLIIPFRNALLSYLGRPSLRTIDARFLVSLPRDMLGKRSFFRRALIFSDYNGISDNRLTSLTFFEFERARNTRNPLSLSSRPRLYIVLRGYLKTISQLSRNYRSDFKLDQLLP